MIGLLNRIDPMVRLIIAALALALILPVYGAGKAAMQSLANAMVFVLFLLYGLKLARADVLAGLRNIRLLSVLVLWVFGVMAAAGWLLWHTTLPWLPPLLALGFLYLGVLPSTIQSATVYTSLAGGNVATSVVSAALLNLIGVLISAPLFSLLAGTHGAVSVSSFGKVATMMLLPFIIGQAAQGWFGEWAKRHKRPLGWLERGTIGISVYSAFSSAVIDGIFARVSGPAWAIVTMGCAALLLLGYGGSILLARWLGLNHGDRVAMVFSCAQKSVAMGAPLAMIMFPPAEAGIILLPLLAYHLAQMLVAAQIAVKLRASQSH